MNIGLSISDCVDCPIDLLRIFPNTYFIFIPFHLQCWDDCSSASASVNRAVAATWPLSVTSMVRDGSLVSANVAWHAEPLAPKGPSDCLVTWEVSGGGLIGNLLTQTSFVELSLWPDTKYRVQVTCKNKVSCCCCAVFGLTKNNGIIAVSMRCGFGFGLGIGLMVSNLFVHGGDVGGHYRNVVRPSSPSSRPVSVSVRPWFSVRRT